MPEITQQELSKRLTEARQEVGVGVRYQHYRDPEYTYVILDVALVEETLEPAVVYRAEYGERLTFIRPISVWCEMVKIDGRQIPRFSKIDKSK